MQEITKTVLLAGGTGLVGRRLSKLLQNRGYTIHIFTRKKPDDEACDRVQYFNWDPARQFYDAAALENVSAIINLAGAGVADQRWTASRKSEIIESRVKAGNLIVNMLKETPNRVQTVINASAQGWYGADTPAATAKGGFCEDAPPATDFLGDTCMQWEMSVEPLQNTGKRLVIFRIGIVLSPDGGYLKEMLRPLRFKIAPVFGHGRQTVSWIHTDDLCGMMMQAVENNQWSGVYNAAAPAPVQQRQLIGLIAAAAGKKCFKIPVPEWTLRLLVGEMSVEVLKSVTLNTQKVQDAGYRFLYPDAETALKNLLEVKG